MNSGKIIKILGIIFIFIMLLLVVVSFSQSVIFINGYGMRPELGAGDILLLALALVASTIPGTMIYGFGALIDSNISMNKKMDTLISNSRQPQAPRYEPSVPRYEPPAPQPVYNPQPVYTPPVPPAPAAAPTPAPAPVAPIIDEPTMVFPVLGDLNQDSPVTDVPVAEEPTGWTCSNCGAQYPTLTPFCRNCGNPRI